MNEYTNRLYIPKVHDFGDDYHLPDIDEDIDQLPMTQVKKIRRRYQNWFSFIDACTLYDNYMTGLKEKYGGDTQFRLALLMGKVREYIPNYPVLRKTKKNKYYRKNRIPKVYREEVTFEPVPQEEIDKLPDAKVSVRLSGDEKIDNLYEASAAFIRSNIAQITGELDMLNAYWIRNNERIEKMKGGKTKKRKLKRALDRKTLRLSMQYRSLSDMLALHEKRKRDKFFNRSDEDTHLAYYKGNFVSIADQDQLDMVTRLKNLGVVFSKLTKSSTKLIRKKIHGKFKSRKKDEKRRRKHKKMELEFARELTGQDYSDYAMFEADMAEMTGSRRFDKY